MFDKIKQFCEDNKLTFKSVGSSLNSDYVILAGFCAYLSDLVFREDKTLKQREEFNKVWYEAEKYLDSIGHSYTDGKFGEVCVYAYVNSYESFWYTEDAKKQYKF